VSELAVFLRVGPLYVALAGGTVTRLVLPDAAVHVAGEPSTLDVGGDVHAAWDLGALLGRDPMGVAWVLLRVPYEHASIRIALRTGSCVGVGEMPDAVPLPRGTFTSRTAAIRGAFAARGEQVYGLVLDPAQLLSREELAASAAIQRKGRAA